MGTLRSPRWNGETVLPAALHAAAVWATANAVSVPKRESRRARPIAPPAYTPVRSSVQVDQALQLGVLWDPTALWHSAESHELPPDRKRDGPPAGRRRRTARL